MRALPLALSAGLLLCAWSSGQTQPKLTARELFYTPVSNVKQTPAQTPAPTPKPPRKQTPPKPKAESVPTPPKAEPEIVKQRRTEDPRVEMVSGLPPLAIRYSLLKHSGGDTYTEVDPETVFRSGDRIRVAVESNDDAYLYIVQQGSSKTWNVLFPNSETEHGSNQIERNRQYTIPAGGRFTFDDQPGTERLFIVVARQPVPDMESLIYSLTSTTPSSNQPKVLLAEARPIEDVLMSKLRNQLVARDLVFEKVDESTAGPKKETAMYVATQDRTPGARIVVDLNLVHR